MGWLGNLGKILGVAGAGIAAPFTAGTSLSWLPAVLGAGGAAASAIGQSKTQNRDAQLGAQFDLQQLLMDREREEGQRDRDYFSQNLQREQDGRVGRDDAWKKLLAAQHTTSPGARPQLSPYSIKPREATEMERSGADAMSQEVMQRLQGGNPLQAPTRRDPLPMPAMDPSLMKPGGLEQAAGWLSPLLAYLGRDRNAPQGQPPVSTTQPVPGTRTSFIDPRRFGGTPRPGVMY